MESEGNTQQESADYLKEEIRQTEQKLKQLDIQLNDIKSQKIVTVNQEDATHVIYSAKKNLLDQEISVTTSEPASVIPDDRRLQEELLQNNLISKVEQLETLLKLVRNQRQELKEAITREQTKGEGLDLINHEMGKLLEKESKEESEMEYQEESIIAKLTQRQEALDSYLKDVSGKMVQFISKHYPPPTQEAITKSNDQNIKYSSLKSIIKELFTKTTDQPHDPYITLEAKHWGPYIEMLLRCRIASRHPQDSTRIKLKPYHL